MVETVALLQARIGLAAVRSLHEDLCPLLDVTFVDHDLHEAAAIALLASGKRRVSLVDWVSFTVMRRLGMTEAFAFDEDFADHGFTLVPEPWTERDMLHHTASSDAEGERRRVSEGA